jgi:hypothetical protein
MQLKDKVTKELEHKVLERTLELNNKNTELEEINTRLQQQSREINQINSMLDLDNWKLKNSLKEVLNEMLQEKTMDYRQFQTLYPDALSCYRFLEQLKWTGEFRCRKCANEKYFDGSQKFSRRCTRCGYNESITAFTIAYLAVTAKKDYTLETLARQLELRVNTVWSFRQKVFERIKDLEKKGTKPTVSRWEDVIIFQDAFSKHGEIRHRSTLKTSL